MADLYGTGGLSDISQLSGPNQTTARQVQQAFVNSMKAAGRGAERYNLPALSNFNEDNALAQAQTSAGLINSNQQLQNVIDASHATPHGLAQNLAAYLPLLGGANALAGTLFGRSGAGGLAENGLVGLATKGYNYITHPASGSTYPIDANGNVLRPAGVPPASEYGTGDWGNAADFGTGGWGMPGNAADFGPSFDPSVADTVGSDWASGLFGG